MTEGGPDYYGAFAKAFIEALGKHAGKDVIMPVVAARPLAAYWLSLPKTTSGSIHDEVRREAASRRCYRSVEQDDQAVRPWPERDASGHGCSRQHRP
jgi:hypothetical protein